MLNEEALERLSERLVNRIEELNLYMIEKLGEQIVDIGTLTPSQLREVFQSVKYGNNLDEIINKIAEITDKNVNDIYKILEEVAKQSQGYSKQFYEYKNIKFIPFEENVMLQNQVKSIAQVTVDEYMNMSRTIAYTFYNDLGVREFNSLSETYQKITDRAILSISQGRESFDTVMKRTMKELTSQGLRTVDYASGYSRRMDSSVRMNIMDGIRRLNRELQIQFGKEFGADGVEISHHKNAAPDHIDTVDGKQFSIKGELTVKGVKYQDYNAVNNNLKRHVGELNCYHFIYPIILGISKPLYSKEKLEDDKKNNEDGFEFEGKHYTMYEGTQLQRKIETKIRQYKDRQVGAKTINDTDEVYHCQEKIRQLTQKYHELSDVSELPTKIDRLRVEGYKSVKIKKDTNLYKDVTQEWLDKAIPNSHELKLDNYFIDDKSVKHPIKDKEVVHPVPISGDEYEKAVWIKNKFGGNIHIVPRITDISNEGLKVSTPDYRWDGKKWDLKTPTLNGNFKTAIERFMKQSKTKKQAQKFIIDFKYYSDKSDIEIIELAKKTLSNPARNWIEDLILVKGDKLIKIYSRKK